MCDHRPYTLDSPSDRWFAPAQEGGVNDGGSIDDEQLMLHRHLPEVDGLIAWPH